jgi:hypothetical protein
MARKLNVQEASIVLSLFWGVDETNLFLTLKKKKERVIFE